MRRITVMAALVLSLILTAVPALAITDGTPDTTDEFPFVGVMVSQDPDGNPIAVCSGTLISPTLYLTAGHCTFDAAHVEIWFDADVESGAPDNGYPFVGEVGGTPYTHPQFDPRAFYLHDLGVVVLDEPVRMPNYGQLPQLGQLDQLSPGARTLFTTVGYGVQKSYPDAAYLKIESRRVRTVAHPQLIQINRGRFASSSLLLSNNAHTGGTCHGDSGGPNFLGDSLVIAGVTSFGKNVTCAGTGGVYRLDQSDDLDWLATFS